MVVMSDSTLPPEASGFLRSSEASIVAIEPVCFFSSVTSTCWSISVVSCRRMLSVTSPEASMSRRVSSRKPMHEKWTVMVSAAGHDSE